MSTALKPGAPFWFSLSADQDIPLPNRPRFQTVQMNFDQWLEFCEAWDSIPPDQPLTGADHLAILARCADLLTGWERVRDGRGNELEWNPTASREDKVALLRRHMGQRDRRAVWEMFGAIRAGGTVDGDDAKK